MGPDNSDLSLAETCLVRLSLELSQLEQGFKANLTFKTQTFVQQFADLRAQTESVLEQIAALQHQSQTAAASPSRDRQWHALKAAIRIYRKADTSTDEATRTKT